MYFPCGNGLHKASYLCSSPTTAPDTIKSWNTTILAERTVWQHCQASKVLPMLPKQGILGAKRRLNVLRSYCVHCTHKVFAAEAAPECPLRWYCRHSCSIYCEVLVTAAAPARPHRLCRPACRRCTWGAYVRSSLGKAARAAVRKGTGRGAS